MATHRSLPPLLASLASLASLAACGVVGCSHPNPPPGPTPTDGTQAAAPPRPAPPVAQGSAPTSTPAAPAASAEAAPKPAGATGGPLNVLLISIDSLRADMPWAGYPRAIAPNLTALHAKSVSYTHAYSTSSFTSKSVAGMLSGRYPSELARTGRFFTKYFDDNVFMCERLHERGTPCVGGHAHAYMGKGLSGFEQGFSDWRLVPNIPFDYNKDPYVTSQALTPMAIEMLSAVSKGSAPFFAWFHYMDPHDEYKRHDESTHFGKTARDIYDEEVFYTDLWIGKLLDWVKTQPWAARTAIVVTADHGEGFGEHSFYRHAHEVWEPLVRVPLFVMLPDAAPRVIDAPRGHADLVPTFLELLGAPADTGLPGASLVGELRGGATPQRDVVVDLPEDEYNERRRALVHGRYKLTAFGKDTRFTLYDLEADPGELTDLARTRKDLTDDLRERYRAASARIPEVAPRGGIPKH
ncbi:MAG: sulfatase [Myxococcales bacterium]|nr:sulfatase [Myxococcales bacterium]HQY62525.1 sulfatase [Polyangiaceae bacterium]